MNVNRLKRESLFKNKRILSLNPLAQQGHANTIYLAKTSQKKYLIREFKINIDRKKEFSIQKKAHAKGIGAKPILLNEKYMISEYLEGIHKRKLSQQHLKKMAKLLKKLHKIKVRQKRNHFKEHFNFRDKKVKQAFMVLDKEPKEYALGHNDLHPQNIIFTPLTIKLIDWEYARYSDIYFDLVSIIIEYKLNIKDREIFLRSYFGNRRVNYKKIKAFTLIYKELWRLWFEKLEKGEL